MAGGACLETIQVQESYCWGSYYVAGGATSSGCLEALHLHMVFVAEGAYQYSTGGACAEALHRSV